MLYGGARSDLGYIAIIDVIGFLWCNWSIVGLFNAGANVYGGRDQITQILWRGV